MFQIFNSKLIKTIVPPSMTTKGNSSSTDSKQVISNSMSHQVNRSLRNYILFFTVEYSVEFCLTGQRPEDSHLTPITILHTHQECTNQQWAFFFPRNDKPTFQFVTVCIENILIGDSSN